MSRGNGRAPEESATAALGPSGDGAIDVGQLWEAVRGSPAIVLGVGLTVFAAVMVVTLTSHMEFRASGQLYLGELVEQSKPTAQLDISNGGAGDVGSEVEILRSRSSVRDAVAGSGLNVQLWPLGWAPPRYWKWLASKRDVRLLDVAAQTLSVSDSYFLEQSHPPETFSVRFVSSDEFVVQADDGRTGRGRLNEPLQALEMHLLLKPGEAGHPAPGAEYVMSVMPLEQTVDDAASALKVTAGKGIGSAEPVKVVTVEFTHGSPRGAALFLRQLMESYLEARQSWKVEDASAAEAFVTNQLKSLRESLDKTEQKLSEYRSSSGVVVMDSEAQAIVEQLGRFEEQRVHARLQVAGLNDMMRALKNPGARIEAYLVGELDDKVLVEAASNLASARNELNALEGRFHADAPDVRQQRAQVEHQLGTVRNYVATRLGRAQDSLNALNGVIAQYEAKLRTVPGAEQGLAQIARESEVFARIYSYLLERQQQTAIAKASTVSKNRILDEPRRPFREDSPKLALRLASLLLGLLAGVLVVVVRFLTATRFQSEADIRRALGGVPILASIPVPKLRRRGLLGGGQLHDVLSVDPTSGYAEAFRLLRTSLYQRDPRSGCHVILVSSPSVGDGKTTMALALGAMLAADQRTVIVVDADVRKPSHHELLRTEITPGLRDVLSGTEVWPRAVKHVRLSYGEMFSLSAGRMGPAELLNGERLAALIAQLRSRFDVVIFDIASFPLVSDALVFSGFVDTVLSVFRLGHTPKAEGVRHASVLGSVAANHAVVVNGARDMQGGYGASYPQRRRSSWWQAAVSARKPV